ncbi:hypothetical protein NOVOSPHI9U_560027 [Novosphingobium sp. 9U]|nr:hypothetical protein NOVOSPHI9U_560027 [Novosphingobium sp. 9U]
MFGLPNARSKITLDSAFDDLRPWNEGRIVGAKRALKPQQVRAIRFWLDQHRRLRDRAPFDLAIDSKLRGCDVVKVRIGDITAGGRIATGQSSCSRRRSARYSSRSLNQLGNHCSPGLNDVVAP